MLEQLSLDVATLPDARKTPRAAGAAKVRLRV